MLRYILLILLSVACQTYAFAERKPYEIASVPTWVRDIKLDATTATPIEQVAKGAYYLLSDNQVRVDAAERVSYKHFATKALNGQGVESVANIEIEFDPSFQKLTLHTINVHRGDLIIPKLSTSNIRVLQREKDLEALILDGSKTASIFLSDVRVGDIVEYAYSLRGSNPVFGKKHFGAFDLQWAVPVARIHARLLWPKGREIFFKHHNNAPVLQPLSSPVHEEYRWDLNNTAALKIENDTPAWFDPYPFVQWSEFKDWHAVTKWAVPLYNLPQQIGSSVQTEIDRIAKQHPTAEQRLLETLRFVQREVRYLGMEIGAGSHAPSSPEIVLNRRFGDCKDKALLTVAMLRGLGIEANTALVHTKQRRSIEKWQPSPGSFNHVVVRARINDQNFWIDPTRSPQPGGLAQLVQAEYGPALVIKPDSATLEPMAGDKALRQVRKLNITINSNQGYDKPVEYTVQTQVEGAAANSLRESIASSSRDELQKRYLNYYTGYYASLIQTAPLEIKEDNEANKITLIEHYQIKNFWEPSKSGRYLEGVIETPELASYMRQPKSLVRASPLSLLHPIDIEHTTQVILPSKWDIKPNEEQIKDAAFEFNSSTSWRENTLVFKDSFSTRFSYIDAAEVSNYASNLEKARQASYHTLKHPTKVTPDAASDRPYWAITVVFFATLVGLFMLCMRVYLWNPEPWSSNSPTNPALVGLRGWLYLAALMLIYSFFKVLAASVEIWPAYLSERWINVTEATSPNYHPLWGPALVFALVANLSIAAGLLLCAILFLKRRSSFPRVIISVLVMSNIALTLDLMMALAIPTAADKVTHKDWSEQIRSMLSCFIWCAYFVKSERVRKTFVEKYPTIFIEISQLSK